MTTLIPCSSEGCRYPAGETLWFRGVRGHVHDCLAHAAQLREFADVVKALPIEDGVCPALGCKSSAIPHARGGHIGTRVPPLLPDPELEVPRG